MNDDLKGIGTSGRAGRGNGSTSPSRAARSLAGPGTKKPAAATSPKPAAAKRSTAKKAATTTVKPAATTKPKAAKKASSAKKATAAPEAAEATQPTGAGADNRHLHAVPDDAPSADSSAGATASENTASENTTSDRAGSDVPPSVEADLDPEDVAAAFAEGAQRLLGSDWQERIAHVTGSLRRRLSGHYEVDEFGLDPEVLDLLIGLVEPIAEGWFRLQMRGLQNIPTEGGALLVANHSGTVPVDGLIMGYAVRKYSGRAVRALGADLVFRLPYVGQFARKMGATLACADDAERLLSTGELAAVWPEGFKGVGKPFSERYKLQRFGRGGFVSAAMRAQVPIIPVSIVGAEEIYPLIGNIPSLARLLGVPYIPITPFFPLLGPLGLIPLPSKWIIEFGEPIRTDAFPPDAADDPMLLFNVTDQVRETIQQTLYTLLVERGNPFV